MGEKELLLKTITESHKKVQQDLIEMMKNKYQEKIAELN